MSDFMHREVFRNAAVGMTVCDSSGQCVAANNAICDIVGATMEQVLSQNYHQLESWRDSGLVEATAEALASNKATHLKVTLTSSFGRKLTAIIHISPFAVGEETFVLFTFDEISELQRMQEEQEELIASLQQALSEIETLRRILPLCSFCRKIQNEQGQWEDVDIYLRDNLSTDVSHGVCPRCMQVHYAEFADPISGNEGEA